MRAIVSTGSDVMELKPDYPKPSPAAGFILIRVKAFTVHPSDIGGLKTPPTTMKFPRVWGSECVGIVEDNGGLENIRIGSVVAALLGGLGREIDGGWAEFVSVPYQHTYPLRIPLLDPTTPLDSLFWSRIASIPRTFLSAFGILDSLHLKPKDRLLVRGGNSPLGLALINVAKHVGASVAVTTTDPTKAPLLSEVGADFVVLEREGGVVDDVKMFYDSDYGGKGGVGGKAGKGSSMGGPSGAGADKIADLLDSTLSDSLASLRPGGVCCLLHSGVSKLSSAPLPPPGTYLTTFDPASVELHRAPLQEIVERCVKGVYRVPVAKCIGLEDVVSWVLAGGEGKEGTDVEGSVVCFVGEA
ncbi:hypothetical protein HK097_005964 [Rhizophlyctis rosea]|uniref:Enoyl reductase (ER) domain-containing protein n=1 Tax=Rhizophlyctis rosea TaxID=64517 RepID=A0AAD5X897_9FUNG|nr:hypothetical protein HK097_005964 [Rhizophlyctis rosea]